MKKPIIFIITMVMLAIAPHIASADDLGKNQTFFVNNKYDAHGRSSVNATLRYVSDRAYFYVEDNFWFDAGRNSRELISSRLRDLGREYDYNIYPKETDFFGPEPRPGIDGDSRITVLLAPLRENAGGYYDTTNQYPKNELPSSNERDMVYLNINFFNDQEKLSSFLAHEFQHLISFNQKENNLGVSDDIWLNELRSEYAVTLSGYNDEFANSHLEKRLAALKENPYDSITEWKNQVADYGQITIFAHYFTENWPAKILADTLKTKSSGVNGFNEALAQNGFKESFEEVFANWLAANVINSKSVNLKFGYSNINLDDFKVTPDKTVSNVTDGSSILIADSIKDWEPHWYEINNLRRGEKNFLKIEFSSSSLTSFSIYYLVFASSGEVTLHKFTPDFNNRALYPGEIGDVARIILMPVKKDKLSGFGTNETPVDLKLSVSRSEASGANPELTPDSAVLMEQIAQSENQTDINLAAKYGLSDGSLIRARGDFKVYVINGNWRRHIVSPKIFDFYPHLGFDKVIEVEPDVLNLYQESRLVRFVGALKVYEIDDLGQKHWLDMSGEKFSASGRAWDAIFLINDLELLFYKEGTNITGR